MTTEIPVIGEDASQTAPVIELRPGVDAGQQAAPPQDYPEAPGERRKIVPQAISRGNVKATASQWTGNQAHRTAFHGLRIPWYGLKTLRYALRGAGLVLGSLILWWHWPEGWLLESQGVAADSAEARAQAMRAHTEGKQTRSTRGKIIAATTFFVIVAAVAVRLYAPWYVQAVLALVLALTLAHYGRPTDKTITTPAVVPPQYEDLTADVVFRALGALGIAGINDAIKNGRGMALVDPIHRDGPGWLANVDLPYGVTAGDVMDRRESLASGLRRALGCVWPEAVQGQHPGRLGLWVGYEDMSKANLGTWPLARRGTADLFKPVLIARDQRMRPVEVTLMFASVIIGSIPRMGKTFLLRLLLLIAALDVRAEVHAYDLKGTGDLSALERVGYRYRVGDDEEDIEYALDDMRALLAEMRRRTKVIRTLPKEQCPENKVTPELASRRSLRLHPIVVGADECQMWFEHPKYGKEFEAICTDLVKRGPALGIILILATQRPDAKSIPTGISANAVLRMCLKVMGWQENDMVLGTGAHKNGVKATMFARTDRGIFYLSGESDDPRISHGYNVDNPKADVIALRARALREQAGTLSGYCVGSDGTEGGRSFLADVLAVFGGDSKLYLGTIAARLADQMPEAYADINPDAVGAQLRELGVKVKPVREPNGKPLAGCERAAAEAVLGARETADV